MEDEENIFNESINNYFTIFRKINKNIRAVCNLPRIFKNNCKNIIFFKKKYFFKNEIINSDILYKNFENFRSCPENFCVRTTNNENSIKWTEKWPNNESPVEKPNDIEMLIPMKYYYETNEFIPIVFSYENNLENNVKTLCRQYSKYVVKLNDGKKTFNYFHLWSLYFTENLISVINCEREENHINKCRKKIISKFSYYDNLLLKMKCFDKPIDILKNASSKKVENFFFFIFQLFQHFFSFFFYKKFRFKFSFTRRR